MTTTLEVAKRDAAAGRAGLPAGHVPAVVYGPQQEPINISVDEVTLDKLRKEAGESTIISLQGLDTEAEVLIKQIDFDPAKQAIIHADFYAIERGKEMTVTVPFEFEGEAPAEKNNIGSVTKAMHEIEVTCRPSNLPPHITVDLSPLVDADSKIHVSDLPKLEGIVYEAEPEDTIAVISVHKQEADEDPEPVDMSAVATEEKGGAPEGETAAE